MLWLRIAGEGHCGEPMPPSYIPEDLSLAEKTTIYRWISQLPSKR